MTLYQLDRQSPSLPGGFCWIAPNATVVGKVALGPDSSIWFGAVLRGDTELISVGEGTNVQDNAVLHTDEGYPLVIGRNCTIGHGAVLHGCTIGDTSLVGMGAIVLNGADIGRSCLVGAGALVTSGTVVPDGSLVLGSPAKVVRRLDGAELERLAASAAHYQANARRFAEGLAALSTHPPFGPA